MLRKGLLYLSTASWARNIATSWGIARRVARRFVAGETLDDAVEATRTLNDAGISVTLDYLGESIYSEDDARQVLSAYTDLLHRIHSEKLNATISVKLTHLGLDISEELCLNNMRQLATIAQSHDIGITIDMESTDYTDTTLRLYRTLRDEYDFDNIGTVIQAYLYRSEADMQALANEGAHIRLCKGAYLEPPDRAFPQKSDVDANYIKLTEQYLTDDNPDAYLCIATHDENMIAAAERIIDENNIPADRYEFQMLYGIRSDRQTTLAQSHTIRIYVPFGEAWYPYFMRRLAERPANVWFFAKALFS